ncbi:hypothetical protein [Candidatus Nitrosotalea okcheonensis]|uniref:hypothetical protein n=1 Tax=Candidatus Nitrosotalea okcheonensis TaxID=1903276 RepID=UPI00130007A0|nr:hypothetical protein [Candidatus Nitrosotalea okcheonensis]
MSLHLFIIAILGFVFIGNAISFADNTTSYYNQMPNPPITFVSNQQNLISVSLKQGESIQLPILVKMNQDYTMESITQIMLVDDPSGVQGWVDPNMLSDTIDVTHLANGTLYLYVDSTTTPGNYTVKIVGRGAIKEVSTGKDIQIMNPSEVDKPEPDLKQGIDQLGEFWKRQAAESGLLGTIHLQIVPNPSSISLQTGELDQNYGQFCSNDTDHGTMCLGFITNQQLPLNLVSDSKIQVQLEMSSLPNGGWVEVYPKTLQVGPSGSSSKLLMAGAEWPPGINPSYTKALTIRALSQNGDVSTVYVPITVVQNVTVLHSSGPIQFEKEVPMNSNQKQNAVYGVVYDPIDDSNQIQSSLKILGVVNETKIVPLPSWLEVEIPNSTFTLKAREPYYLMINPMTSSAPEGTFVVAIEEHVGERSYVQNMTLHVFNMHYSGASGQSLSLGPALPLPALQSGPVEDSWIPLVGFGGIVGGVATVLSVYIVRKNKK